MNSFLYLFSAFLLHNSQQQYSLMSSEYKLSSFSI